jgi:hypothetical protein
MTDWTSGGGSERPETASEPPVTGEPRTAAEFRPEFGEPPGGAEFRPETGESRTAGVPREARLLPRDECDQYELRLQHAVGRFVDRPREAVEEADQVVQEVASRLAEAVSSRRRTLKASWQPAGDEPHPTADTEQLRLALRDYRATAERLLSM